MVFFVFAAAIAVICLAVSAAAILITRFREETRELCDDMDSAVTYEQYMECLRALRCHYIKLIPFVSDRNIGRVYDRIYGKEKPEEKQPRREGFVTVLAPSLIGICLCIICLCGISFAWFTNSISSGSNKIQAANYYVDIVSNQNAVSGDTLALTANTVYEVTVNVGSGATATTGYVIIKIGGSELITATIPQNGLKLYISSSTAADVKFEAHWGTPASPVIPNDKVYDISYDGSTVTYKEHTDS